MPIGHQYNYWPRRAPRLAYVPRAAFEVRSGLPLAPPTDTRDFTPRRKERRQRAIGRPVDRHTGWPRAGY